ncbi:hypothetical protein F4778DRAFT_788761 [Xylariomycetidae sp. FL2044]|nr:hypothetical protein F4778DRAFT_788761 [Xylariomycetidae sp. FL2044]
MATGTFEKPFEPDVEGLEEWKGTYPDSVSHSKTYRNAEDFRDQRVLVVGNAASGWDISLQIAATAKDVWVSSTRPGVRSHEKIISVGDIERLIPEKKLVEFKDGKKFQNVDAIVLCTGYLYSLPFLRKGARAPKPLYPSGAHIEDLWEHMFWTREPTLMFVGIPKAGPTFLLSQAQSALLARALADRWLAPSKVDMAESAAQELERWMERRRDKSGVENEQTFHNLPYPQCKEYIERLAGYCAEADETSSAKVPDGNPPFEWTRRIDFVMRQRGKIRAAFFSKGVNRHRFPFPESLDIFDDDDEVAEQEVAKEST